MSWQVELAKREDIPELDALWSRVYVSEDDAPQHSERDWPEGQVRTLLRSEGRIVAAAISHPFVCMRGQDDLKCAGLASVATALEARQSGAATALTHQTLRILRENGYAISSLYAYSDAFYRRLGYEICGARYKIVCPVDELPKSRESAKIQVVPHEEAASLNDIYERFARSFSGAFRRDEYLWKRRLGRRAQAIYKIGEPEGAYFWANVDDFWSDLTIGECAYTDQESYLQMLCAFRSLATHTESVTWYEPMRSPFLAAFGNAGAKYSLHRWTMFRIVDVKKALEACTTTASGRFTISVQDDQIEENTGTYQVCAEDGRINVSYLKGESNADLACTVGRLSQALMGQPSLLDLAQIGLIQVKEQRGLSKAAEILPAIPVTCMDFF